MMDLRFALPRLKSSWNGIRDRRVMFGFVFASLAAYQERCNVFERYLEERSQTGDEKSAFDPSFIEIQVE